VQGRVALVDVPTPQTRSANSTAKISNTGAKMVVAETANQRRQRKLLSVGTASVIWVPAGTVIFSTKFLGFIMDRELKKQLSCHGNGSLSA
jgi:hypothetical protein